MSCGKILFYPKNSCHFVIFVNSNFHKKNPSHFLFVRTKQHDDVNITDLPCKSRAEQNINPIISITWTTCSQFYYLINDAFNSQNYSTITATFTCYDPFACFFFLISLINRYSNGIENSEKCSRKIWNHINLWKKRKKSHKLSKTLLFGFFQA